MHEQWDPTMPQSSPGMRTPADGIDVRWTGGRHLRRPVGGRAEGAQTAVDLTIAAGERVAMLGPSGSGKSTLMTLLGGIQRPSAGQIYLDDHNISRMGEGELTRLRASRVSTVLQGAHRNLLPYA